MRTCNSQQKDKDLSVSELNRVFSNISPRGNSNISDADIYNLINEDMKREKILNSTQEQRFKSTFNKGDIFTTLNNQRRDKLNTWNIDIRAKSTINKKKVSVSVLENSLNINIPEEKHGNNDRISPYTKTVSTQR